MTDEASERAKLQETAEFRLFLLRLSDRLRAIDDPIAIQQAAATMLGEHLGANRCAYAGIEGESFIPGPAYVRGVPALPATPTPISAYGDDVLETCRRGGLLSSEDVSQDPKITPQELANYRAMHVAAYLGIILIKGGQPVAVLGVHVATPHKWTPAEMELVREVGDRTWAAVERARAENALRQSEEQLRHAITLRDEFLAVLSHELRTPLSAILIWAKMLRAGAVKGEEKAQAIAVIEQSAIAQRKLIEDLLDVSGMISGKVRMHMETAEIGPILAAAVEAVNPMAEAKHVTLTLDLGSAPLTARIDRSRLQQVVWNLANNAVKFTPPGGKVAVRLQRVHDTTRIEVQDTGCGIASTFLPYVFERFRQADSGTTRTYGGLGLGLAIARQLVELHGGTIEGRSKGQGKGATFIVELPRTGGGEATNGPHTTEAAAQTTSEPYSPTPVLNGVRVLFVEDETHTRTVVQWLLEQCGAEVTPTASANEALAALGLGQAFDLLLSDLGLPEKDGYELLAEVRRNAAGARLPALALTAYAREEDRRRAMAAGFDAYLAKPVEPRILVETIAAMMKR